MKQTAWLKAQPEIVKMGQMLPFSWLNQLSLTKNETQPEGQGEDVLLRVCVVPSLPWIDFGVSKTPKSIQGSQGKRLVLHQP